MQFRIYFIEKIIWNVSEFSWISGSMKLIPNQSHGWIQWKHKIQFIIFHIQPNNTIYHPRPSRRFYIRKGRQGGMKTWERSLPTRSAKVSLTLLFWRLLAPVFLDTKYTWAALTEVVHPPKTSHPHPRPDRVSHFPTHKSHPAGSSFVYLMSARSLPAPLCRPGPKNVTAALLRRRRFLWVDC